MLHLKKKNLQQWFFVSFVFCFFNVSGGEGKEQKARQDHTA